MPPAIAELIRTGRLRKGLNQEDLAQQAGVSRTTLHHLERGAVQRPRASTLSRLASVLELDPQELVEGWQPPTEPSPPPEWVSEPARFDQATNRAIAEAYAEAPQRFAGFSPEDWEELASQVGVGGGLTLAGVYEAAERIAADRETVAQLRVVLQTHLRGTAQEVIRALFQTVAVTGEGAGPTAGPPERSPQESQAS